MNIMKNHGERNVSKINSSIAIEIMTYQRISNLGRGDSIVSVSVCNPHGYVGRVDYDLL